MTCARVSGTHKVLGLVDRRGAGRLGGLVIWMGGLSFLAGWRSTAYRIVRNQPRFPTSGCCFSSSRFAPRFLVLCDEHAAVGHTDAATTIRRLPPPSRPWSEAAERHH